MSHILTAVLIVIVFQFIGIASQQPRPGCYAKACDDRPECPKTSCRCLYASRMDCTVYYMCIDGKPFQYKCSPGLLFNNETLSCDYSYNVNCYFSTASEATTEDKTTSMFETTTEIPSTKLTTEDELSYTTKMNLTSEITTNESFLEHNITSTLSDNMTTEASDTTKLIITSISTEEKVESTWMETTEFISTKETHPSDIFTEDTSSRESSKTETDIQMSTDLISTTEPQNNFTTLDSRGTFPSVSTEATYTTTRSGQDVSTSQISTLSTNEAETTTLIKHVTEESTTSGDNSETTVLFTTKPNIVTLTTPVSTINQQEISSAVTETKIMTSSENPTTQFITESDMVVTDIRKSTDDSTIELTSEEETTPASEITTNTPSGKFVCPSRFGLYPDPSSCFRFYHCSHWMPYHKWCPSPKLHFNPKLKVCDWPYRAGCASSTTSEPTTEIFNATSSVLKTTTNVSTEFESDHTTETPLTPTNSESTTNEHFIENNITSTISDSTIITDTTSIEKESESTWMKTTDFTSTAVTHPSDIFTEDTSSRESRKTETDIQISTDLISTTEPQNNFTTLDNRDTFPSVSTEATYTTTGSGQDVSTSQISTLSTNEAETTTLIKHVTEESTTSGDNSETTVLFTTKPDIVTLTTPVSTINQQEISSAVTETKIMTSSENPTTQFITESDMVVTDIRKSTDDSTIDLTSEEETTPASEITTNTPSGKFVCPSRFGLYPDPNNCFRFYHCSHWMPYHKWCPSKLHFNPELNVCDWPYRAGCDASDQRTSAAYFKSTASPHRNNTQTSCDCDYCELPVPGDCSAYLLCIDKTATRMQCSTDLYFNPMTGTCDFQENVHCAEDVQCQETGRFLYPGSCSYFVECRDGDKSVRKCPEGLQFNGTSEMCGWTGSCSDKKPGNYPDSENSAGTAICEGCNYCFKPYAEDCTNYVRCFQDKTTERKCSQGLYFNPNTELCDYGYNVNCSRDKSKIMCPKDFGYFPYPGECNSYLQCFNSNATIKKCPGILHFDPIKKHCDWPWVAGCGNSSSEPTSEPNMNSTDCNCDCCLKSSENDCRSFTVCINKLGFSSSCSSGLLFNPETENCDFAENVNCNITHPEVSNYTCPEYQGLFQHPKDCNKFIHCDHNIPHVKNCSSDLHFNPQLKVCDWPYSAGCQSFPTIQPPVEDDGLPCDLCDSCFLPIENDCTAYMYCRNGTGYKLRCTENLLFNPKTEVCDLAYNVDCPNRPNSRCPKTNGLFLAEDCNKFLHCSNGIAYLKDCPDGLEFNAQKLVCDWPEDAKCGESTPTDSTNPNGGDNVFNGTCNCECCFIPNSKDCSRYFLCLDGILYEGECSRGLLFNPTIQNCDLAERVSCGGNISSCPEPNGLFSNGDKCSSYLRCSSGTPTVEHCTNGLHFSAQRKQCLVPCEAKCDSTYACFTTTTTLSTKSPICLDSEGFYPASNDCSSFYSCSKGVPHMVQCPEGLHYSVEFEVCEDPCDAKCNLNIDCSFSSSASSTLSVSSAAPKPSSTFSPHCPNGKDGLFPSDDDCSIFYQCSGGTAYRISCPQGLHFSTQHQTCEYPCDANCNNTIDCYSSTPDSTTLSPHCKRAEGVYPAPGNCAAFYLCSDGKEHLMRCPPGLHYSEADKTCEEPCVARCNASVECSASTKSESSSTTQPLSPECGSADGLFMNPDDCGSFYQCSNGKSHLIHCPSDLHFSLDDAACEKPCVAGCDITIACPTEIPDTEGNCTCESCYLHDPSDCSAFYFCDNGRLYRGYCPYGTLFDRTSNSCQDENTVDCEINGDPSMCPEPFGYFPYPGDCKKFLHCDNGVANVKECSKGLEYDPSNKVCTEPKGYCGNNANDPHCLEPTGLFPDSENCSLFYHCEHGVAYSKRCSQPLVFNPEKGVCDWPENFDCGEGSTSNQPIRSSTTMVFSQNNSFQSSTPTTQTSTFSTVFSTSELCYKVPGVTCPCACRVPTYDDCSSFFQCLDDGTACKRYCPEGLYFNKREMVCDLPTNVECRDFFFTSIHRAKQLDRHLQFIQTKRR